MSSDFKTTTHGKWILAGEHAVIRGHGALVFPLSDNTLTLTYQTSTGSTANALELSAHLIGHNQQDMSALLRQVLEYGAKLINQPYHTLQGQLTINSTIPAGVGMGASAALCVALTRWFSSQGWIDDNDQYSLARELEHLFHGQSSGLDIAGVQSHEGVYFQGGDIVPLQPTWTPNWRLSSCGETGPTADCIRIVGELWTSNPSKAAQLDVQMHASVLHAKQALEQPYSQQESLPQLAQAINQAGMCFEQWGLVTAELQQHMQDLRNQGAIAVKPTGSGGGGYVVSLWNTLS